MKNNGKNETNENVRHQALEWKRRAKGAEARLVELLREKVRMQDEHRSEMDEMKALVENRDKQLNLMEEAVKGLTDERNNLECELMLVKAHAYDLAFGDLIRGDD